MVVIGVGGRDCGGIGSLMVVTQSTQRSSEDLFEVRTTHQSRQGVTNWCRSGRIYRFDKAEFTEVSVAGKYQKHISWVGLKKWDRVKVINDASMHVACPAHF